MLQDLSMIKMEELVETMKNTKSQGYRFAALTCEKQGEEYELIYHLDKNYQMKNVKVVAKLDEIIPSISNVYPAAFLIENEIQDFYGFKFENLIIDYKGNLYLDPQGPKTPLL